MWDEEIRQSIEKEQSVLISQCKRCGHIFVVNHKIMGHDKPNLDPRIRHLKKCLKDMNIKRLADNFETHRLSGEYKGQRTVFFDKIYLTEEQIHELTDYIKGWLHSDIMRKE